MISNSTDAEAILALSGGVGGAKLALGLADTLPAGALHVLVNTGDDFEHLGLHISPDIDTLLYTLSGAADQAQGWGLAGESWQVMDSLEALGGDTWFRLGDKDLATHLLRTQSLARGNSLLEVTKILASRLKIATHVHPMCAQSVRTTVHTVVNDEPHDLPFQQYFVKEQCVPVVSGFSFVGIEQARPNPQVVEALGLGHYGAIIVCPSNPFVSIDPILSVPGMWESLRDSGVPVVLVSPIVAGAALKGPAAKMMAELGVPVSAHSVAEHYGSKYPGLIQHFVIDTTDATLASRISELGMSVAVTPTIMKTREDKQQLAQFVLNLVRK